MILYRAKLVSPRAKSAAFIIYFDLIKVSKLIAAIIYVPLFIAKPSFSINSNGSKSFIFNAKSAAIYYPSFQISPIPIRPNARCDKGAKSPDAPTEP